MYVSLRRALVVASLSAIAACSSSNPGTSSLPSQSSSMFVHHGVPFLPPIRYGGVRHDAGSYSTKKSLLFESDQTDVAVNIYQTKDLSSNPAPIASIHVAAGCPYGVARDKKGTVYVADNCSGNDVEEYPKGSTTLKTTITDGISNPLGLAIDKAGNLYVSNYPAAITVYPPGATSPSKTITGGGMVDPFGLALDVNGNLYIADFGADAIFEVAAGTTTVTNTGLTGLGEPLGVADDLQKGYLWETDGSGNAINVYQPLSGTAPIETIAGNGFPYAVGIQNAGKPKREVATSDLDTHAVYAYKPGSYTPYATLTNSIETPTGLMITKP